MNELLTQEIKDKFSRVKFKAGSFVDGVFSGIHRSLHSGQSVEFSDYKEYTIGDDTKKIDWKVFGKTDRYFVRRFEDESDLKLWIILDSSSSMGFQTTQMTKLFYGCRVAAILSYIFLRQQDAVGLNIVNDRVKANLPPRAGMGFLHEILKNLEGAIPEGKTSLGDVLKEIIPSIKKRAIVFIISDFFTDLKNFFYWLKRICAKKHIIYLVQILDAEELNFSFKELTLFHDLESEFEFLIEPQAIKKIYLKKLNEFLMKLQNFCHENDIFYTMLSSDKKVEDELLKILVSR